MRRSSWVSSPGPDSLYKPGDSRRGWKWDTAALDSGPQRKTSSRMTSMQANAPRFAAFESKNPLAPPSWRWQRAQSLLASGRRFSARIDDEHTETALRYLRIKARSEASASRTFPHLYAAESIHQSEPTLHVRTLLEARLLAEQSPAEIEAAEGHPAAVVQAYSDCFFDIEARRGACDWIRGRIFFAGDGDYPTLRGRGVLMLGNFNGPIAVDVCAPLLLGRPPQGRPTTIQECVEAKLRVQLELQFLNFHVCTEEYLKKAAIAKDEIIAIQSLRATIERQTGTSASTSRGVPLVQDFVANALGQASEPALTHEASPQAEEKRIPGCDPSSPESDRNASAARVQGSGASASETDRCSVAASRHERISREDDIRRRETASPSVPEKTLRRSNEKTTETRSLKPKTRTYDRPPRSGLVQRSCYLRKPCYADSFGWFAPARN